MKIALILTFLMNLLHQNCDNASKNIYIINNLTIT